MSEALNKGNAIRTKIEDLKGTFDGFPWDSGAGSAGWDRAIDAALELIPTGEVIVKEHNEAKALLETVCFHLRRNDHITPPTGATCTDQIIDRIERFLSHNV